MTDQDQVLGLSLPIEQSAGSHGVVPEQRGPADRPLYGEQTYKGERAFGERVSGPGQAATGPGGAALSGAGEAPLGSGSGRLRVDARRNLESVLRAARQVFGELGYDAPMEEVARRAGVGVGTVYRRFPSKEVLVQRIAAEEVAWLTTQARESLYGGAGPWDALADYLARAVASGAGRLLPPSAFRYAEELGTAADLLLPEQQLAEQHRLGGDRYTSDDADPRLLLHLLAALVARAGAAGELRPGVTVSDVVLVLTAAVPVHVRQSQSADGPDDERGHGGGNSDGNGDGGSAWSPAPGQPHDAPAERLLRILLNGLRSR
ncbi:helix-turn-helix domain-containing protein [Kitasatospora sp. MAP5-34]|uniref:TetR/AcrR family transcriptional regulator n=1 Tax=Kitasatospora sp. MAP5-34 TaxID=3035102 RepID=UPI002477238D|nr:helix-turn-helix domain-containing protein [Kitasatospora sp. MAP5-34]MDH6578782.1 AcrR family transcriptional regulator [Kitasatospora sp. MAP5-34]